MSFPSLLLNPDPGLRLGGFDRRDKRRTAAKRTLGRHHELDNRPDRQARAKYHRVVVAKIVPGGHDPSCLGSGHVRVRYIGEQEDPTMCAVDLISQRQDLARILGQIFTLIANNHHIFVD